MLFQVYSSHGGHLYATCHQIVFWEGHYADIKYGQITGQNGVADTLQVITGGKSIWSVTPVKGTWVSLFPLTQL